MNKFALALAATVVSFSAFSAHAGGWGGHSSGGLINVSPTIKANPSINLGVNALNTNLGGTVTGSVGVGGTVTGGGTGILNGNASGNVGVGIGVGLGYKLKR